MLAMGMVRPTAEISPLTVSVPAVHLKGGAVDDKLHALGDHNALAFSDGDIAVDRNHGLSVFKGLLISSTL